jgi:hypothetical protein
MTDENQDNGNINVTHNEIISAINCILNISGE